MNFKEFIGIDVSKSVIDVFIRGKRLHFQFNNSQDGFKKMTEWLYKVIDCELAEVLFTFENTGLYSQNLTIFLDQQQYNFTVISGLELKRSLGIARGKSDKSDARSIAEYAFEKKEKLKLYEMPPETIFKLRRLSSYRERLVKERTAFKCRLGEYKSILSKNDNKLLFESHQKMIKLLNEEIKKVEQELYKLVAKEQKVKKDFELINSIKSVGPQTALMMIIITNGFTSFKNWRKFSSYSGTAPFPNESGTFKGKTKTSQLANKRIKALLNNCATSAIQYNPEMKLYYEKRIREGKNKMSTINIIRNKLLARIFAVVERRTPYVETFKYAT